MKAVVCTKYGSPDFLELKEIEKPAPKKNEVLIKIRATSVTTSDALLRAMNSTVVEKFILQLIFGFGKPRNPILGMVLSGIVEEIGEKVSKFKSGDEVFAYGSMSSTKLRFGTYAEYICLPEDWNLALKPINLNFEEAAAIPYGGLLASHLIKKANIKIGQNVLIYGASGSIGTMAVQLAKNKAAIVTSVCSSKNLEFIKSLGSDKVIDYTRDNSISLLETYDLVIDTAGKDKSSSLKEKSKKSLSSEGKYISIDDGIPSTPKETFMELRELAEQGRIKPVIDRVYTLEQIAEAHRYVDKRHKRGNVIISIV